jgi:hypothetical protein
MKIDFKVIQRIDTKEIERAYKKNRKKILMKGGAIVRTIARRSLRKRAWRTAANNRGRKSKASQYTTWWGGKTAISNPGSQPFSHTSGKTFGLKTIAFSYDPVTGGVIVGPVGGDRSRNSVPNVLEFGGSVVNTVPAFAHAKKRSLGVSTSRKYKYRKRIAKRPYMAPAIDAFSKSYPKMWRDSIS